MEIADRAASRCSIRDTFLGAAVEIDGEQGQPIGRVVHSIQQLAVLREDVVLRVMFAEIAARLAIRRDESVTACDPLAGRRPGGGLVAAFLAQENREQPVR